MNIELLFEEIEGRELFRAPRLRRTDDGIPFAIDGEVQFRGEWITLRITLPDTFPLALPLVYLVPPDLFGFLPHVSSNGHVCYLDSEGLVLDRRNPVAIVEEAISRTLALLEAGIAGVNSGDFANEFQAHWSRLPNATRLTSLLQTGTRPRWVIVARVKNLRILADTLEQIGEFVGYPGTRVGQEESRALYVPLNFTTTLVPPQSSAPFWSVKEIRSKLLSHLSTENRAALRRIAGRLAQNIELVVFDLPTQDGGSTHFGVTFEGVGRNHPLLEGGVAKSTQPIRIERLDRGYIVARGGGYVSLADKKVLLIGCGAVGGPLAIELAHAGILKLTLVDYDKLGPENTFRHPLGWRWWDSYKVEGLKEFIEESIPYVQVTTVKKSIINALETGEVELGSYDAILFATGNPTVELEVNARLQSMVQRPPAVFCWVEPLGIGGHALLSANNTKRGCLECLYTPPDDDVDAALDNRASFAAAGQHFGRALNGCGTLHTPFGSADAIRTAVLAVRLILDSLLGRECGNPLLSWKGDPTDFENAGFQLAYRFSQSQDLLDERRYLYATERCRVCGARTKGAE